jgi:hypothetical protein
MVAVAESTARTAFLRGRSMLQAVHIRNGFAGYFPPPEKPALHREAK